MTRRFRSWAARAYEKAVEQNLENVEAILSEARPGGTLLDLGCGDGLATRRFAAALDASEVHGVEIVEERAALARSRGVDAVKADLNGALPYDDGRFNVVVSNQVLEHLADTDTFLREIHRVLKPGGRAVVSTENLASWHNQFALALGWQPFSLTNVSQARGGLGNPLALHRDRDRVARPLQHLRVFAYLALKELFGCHGFRVEAAVGAGYFPFPPRVARLDPRHAVFLTVGAVRLPEHGTRRLGGRT